MLQLSRRLALLYGVGLPVLETIRRWSTLWDDPPALLDDYLLGAFLLVGVWMTRGERARHRAVLAAAWGAVLGVAYGSIVGQFHLVQAGGADPGPLSALAVLWIKVVGTAVAAAALLLCVAPGPGTRLHVR